jgi:hypothetical protein
MGCSAEDTQMAYLETEVRQLSSMPEAGLHASCNRAVQAVQPWAWQLALRPLTKFIAWALSTIQRVSVLQRTHLASV